MFKGGIMKRLAFAGIFCAGVLLTLPVCNGKHEGGPYKYAVKFICGKSDGEVLPRGMYMTAINVYNPSDSTVAFTKRFSIALPGETAGPISGFFPDSLNHSEAMEIDCADIYRHMKSRADFLKGFVAINSDEKLKIVAVYSVANANGDVQSLDVEDIRPLKH
jgi:hypothetical protein